MTVEILLNHGASPHVLDRNLETPLHYASRYCYPEIAKMLMQNAGVDPNAVDYRGWTPLHYA
uniref:Ankyrin repeat protein n=1 Tax=Guillardia theta (strain CCMP2712) TaxID=905079 RepID=A0A0C3SM52_GUITC